MKFRDYKILHIKTLKLHRPWELA